MSKGGDPFEGLSFEEKGGDVFAGLTFPDDKKKISLEPSGNALKTGGTNQNPSTSTSKSVSAPSPNLEGVGGLFEQQQKNIGNKLTSFQKNEALNQLGAPKVKKLPKPENTQAQNYDIEMGNIIADANALSQDAQIYKAQGDPLGYTATIQQMQKVNEQAKQLLVKYPDVLDKMKAQEKIDEAYSGFGGTALETGARFQNAVLDGVKKVVSFAPKTASKLTGVEGGPSETAYKAIESFFDNPYMKYAESSKNFQNPDGSLNWNRLAPALGETAGNMLALLGTAEVMGGNGPALFASSYTLTRNDYYDVAKAKGLTDQQANVMSDIAAATTSMLELVSPNTAVFGKTNKTQIVDNYVKALAKGEGAAKQLLFKEIIPENAQEISQMLADKVIQSGADFVTGQDKFDPDYFNTNEYLSTIALTTLTTGLVQGGGVIASNKSAKANALAELAKDPEKTAQILQTQVEAGIITPEEGQNVIQQVQRHAEAAQKVPESIPQDKKADVTEMVAEKDDIEKSIEGKDPALTKREQARIEEIDNELVKTASPELAETKEVDKNAVQERPAEKVGTHEGGNESLGRESKSEGVGQRQQGEETATEKGQVNLYNELKKAGAPEKMLQNIDKEAQVKKGGFSLTEHGHHEYGVNDIFVSTLGNLIGKKSTVIHEAAHSLTRDILAKIDALDTHSEENKKFFKEQWGLTDEQIDNAKFLKDTYEKAKENSLIPLKYGYKNLDEFVAEFVSNPTFRDTVSRDLKEKGVVKKVLDSIFDVIQSATGISVNASDEKLTEINNKIETLYKDQNEEKLREVQQGQETGQGPQGELQGRQEVRQEKVNDTGAEESAPVVENKQYLPTHEIKPGAREQNVNTAKQLLSDLGIKADFTGYSNANGVSVYFEDANGKKIRVSDHGVENRDRIANELLLRFDAKTLGLGGKIGFKSNFDDNKNAVEQLLSNETKNKAEKNNNQTTETNTGVQSEAEAGKGTVLTEKERENLDKIEKETGDNFRLIENTLRKYSPETPIETATVEDYEKAKEKRGEKPPEPPKEKKTEKEPEKKERRFTKQLLADESIPDEVKKAFTEDTIHYNELPNKISAETATTLLNYLGPDEARKAVFDFNNGMGSAVRFIMAQQLLKQFNSEGNYDSANEFLEDFVKVTTDYGQGIQALSLYSLLTPEGALLKAKREISKQRAKRFLKEKTKTGKILKATRKINREAAEETIQKLDKKVEDAATIKTNFNPTSPSYGKKNKIVTRERYEKALKELRGQLFSSPLPPQLIEIGAYHIEAGAHKFADFSKIMVKELGEKVKPYLKEIYGKARTMFENGDILETDYEIDEQLEKIGEKRAEALIRPLLKSGKKQDVKKAIEILNSLPNKQSVWGKYKEFAVNRLKQMTISEIEGDISENPVLDDFTKGLAKNLKQQIEAALPEAEKKVVKGRTSLEIIADAYKNIEKYQDVWEETQKQIREKYADNEEKLEELDSYFGDVLKTPFSEKLITSAVKEGMKTLKQDINNIIRQHYTVYDASKKSLTDKLIEQAALPENEAKELAKAISDTFDKIATEKKQQALEKIFTKKEKKNNGVKDLEQRIIELSNLGAFKDAELLELYAKQMGFPELTEENIREIERLVGKIQTAVGGSEKFRAIEDLLAYQAGIKGTSLWEIGMSLWYAKILSGFKTQMVNFVSTWANTFAEGTVAAVQNPKHIGFLARGYWNGVKRGLLEAQETVRTGYSPIRGKVEVPALLERISFKGGKLNPLNYAKFVRRFMVASDVIFFESLREMRAYQYALKQAIAEDKLEPTPSMITRAYEILNKQDGSLQQAQAQAEQEYQDHLKKIEDSDLSEKEKLAEGKQAARDKKRRVYEIIEEKRDANLLTEAQKYASKGTYNYKPEGALGAAARALNQWSQQVPPLRLVIPFTNIIANVANETLNYTPYGYVRSKTGGTVLSNMKRELTDQEKIDLTTKAIIGTTLMAAIYALTLLRGDDGEPIIEITANGTGDFRKNYTLTPTGWQPYSVRIGKKWYSYQFTPLAVGFSYIGNISDFDKYRNEKLTDTPFATKAGVAATATTRTFLDQTVLSSLSEFLDFITNVTDENVWDDFFAASTKTLNPVPNFYTQIVKQVQDWFDIPTKEVSGTMLGNILRDIPVARDQYYNKINALGEEVVPDADKFVSTVQDQPLWSLLVDKRVYLRVPPFKSASIIEYNADDEPVERAMTREEYYNFCKDRGQIIRDYLQENYEELKAKDPKEVQEELKKVQNDATLEAKEKITE